MKTVMWPTVAKAELVAGLSDLEGVEMTVVEDLDGLRGAIGDAEAFVLSAATYNPDIAAVLQEHSKKLRLIQLTSAGYDSVQSAGKPDGVIVTNGGGSWSPAVGEHAMAMLLALVRRLHDAVRDQQQSRWDKGLAAKVGTVEGSTMVIVGFGSIGKQLAKRARPFGIRIIGVSRSAKPDPLADEVCTIDDLNSVLPRADIVALAIPATPLTIGLFGKAQFDACKPGALLINVARGNVVDPEALHEALTSGKLGGAGLDVTEPEPLPAASPLWRMPNVIITPHVGGASGTEGRKRLVAIVGTNLQNLAAGRPLDHLVTFQG